MIFLFDYIFYKLYALNKWNNESAQRLGFPWHTDLIFDAIFGLSFIQSSIILAIINTAISLLEIIALNDCLLYVWGGVFLLVYVSNELYYRRTKRYKTVLKSFSKKKYSNIPVIMSLLIGITLFALSVELLKKYVPYS